MSVYWTTLAWFPKVKGICGWSPIQNKKYTQYLIVPSLSRTLTLRALTPEEDQQ